MPVGDGISIRGHVLGNTYIPTRIERELVRSGVNCDWKGQIVGIFREGTMAIHSSGQTAFSLINIEGIILVAGEEADEVARGATVMHVDELSKDGD